MVARILSSCFLSLLLAGCAEMQSATNSAVSAGDIPQSKFRKVAVFVENDDAEQLQVEQTIAAELGSGAASGLALMNYSRSRLSPEDKARLIVSSGYDATLYVTVMQKAVVQEPVTDVSPGWGPNGEPMLCKRSSIITSCFGAPSWYSIQADGSILRTSVTLITKSELVDVRSGKTVWAADTTVKADGGNLGAAIILFRQAAREINSKLRADRVI